MFEFCSLVVSSNGLKRNGMMKFSAVVIAQNSAWTKKYNSNTKASKCRTGSNVPYTTGDISNNETYIYPMKSLNFIQKKTNTLL